MQIHKNEKTTYLFLNGIVATKPIKIGEQIVLQPTKCAYNESILKKFSDNDISYGVALMFLPLVGSQLCISTDNSESLAKLAWNSLWDVVLLGALYDCDIACNFQSNTAAQDLHDKSRVEITNYYLHGLCAEPYRLTAEDSVWLESYFVAARKLLDVPEFQHAVHCLSTYRWHSFPPVRLAILWSGIEGLFKIESEIIFRLSLYISRFLEPNDKTRRLHIFKKVKILYKFRSAAVHGSKIKGNPETSVEESAKLLHRIILECIRINMIPVTDDLAP